MAETSIHSPYLCSPSINIEFWWAHGQTTFLWLFCTEVWPYGQFFPMSCKRREVCHCSLELFREWMCFLHSCKQQINFQDTLAITIWGSVLQQDGTQVDSEACYSLRPPGGKQPQDCLAQRPSLSSKNLSCCACNLEMSLVCAPV